MNAENKSLKDVYESRRAVNFFLKDKAIPDEILKSIIDLAVLAPSAFNLQPWELIAVKSEEAKQNLLPLAMNQPKILEAPVTLILIGDLEGYGAQNPEWSVMEAAMGKEAVDGYKQFAAMLYGSTDERKVKFAESNAGLLAMSIMYAAKYYGVDSHPMSGIDFEGIRKEYGLGDSKTPVMLISLGYFDEEKQLYPRRNRLGYDEIVKEL